MARTVVFIHDAWLGPGVWHHFAGRFAACGYRWLAPAWPGIEQLDEHAFGRPDASSDKQPPAGLANLGMDRLLAHYVFLIRTLAEPPLLVGHGVGGLLVQLLLDRGIGAAGVAIAPTPPSGVLPGWSALRRAWPLWSGWATWARPVAITRARFDRDMAQTLPTIQRVHAFDAWVLAASGRLLWQTAVGIGCKVDFDNDGRAALLLVAGEQDRAVQVSTVVASFRLHRRSVAVTDLHVYPGRSHLLITEPGWEAIADACIDWAREQLGGF